jgi:hypothetical protein
MAVLCWTARHYDNPQELSGMYRVSRAISVHRFADVSLVHVVVRFSYDCNDIFTGYEASFFCKISWTIE